MLGRSAAFGPKSIEKRPQQGNLFELTTPIDLWILWTTTLGPKSVKNSSKLDNFF